MSEDMNKTVDNDDEYVKIGSDESKDVELGSLGSKDVNATVDKNLISRDIENAITKKVISNVNVDKVDKIDECISYLIDMSGDNCTVVPSWVKSIKNLIVSNTFGEIPDDIQQDNEIRRKHGEDELRADSALYIKTKGGVTLAGYCDQLQMYKVIRDYVDVSLGKKAKVYVSNGGLESFRELKVQDIRGFRLKL